MDDSSRSTNRVSRSADDGDFGRSKAWLAAQDGAFQQALNGKPLNATLGLLARTAKLQMRSSTRCGFWIADESRAGLHHVVGLQSEFAARNDGFPIGINSLACGLAVATGKPVITSDVREDVRWNDWLWLAEEFDYRGVWSFPVEGDDKTAIGTFTIYFQDPTAATARDLALAHVMTKAAAIIIALHRAREGPRLPAASDDAPSMTDAASTPAFLPPALKRLHALFPLNSACFAVLRQSMQRSRQFAASAEVMFTGERNYQNLIILSGWAAHIRDLKNGRRQVLGFLLPGDLLGEPLRPNPMAVSTVIALTDLKTCIAPAANGLQPLKAAYATSDAFESAYQLAQIARLGSLDAHDRVVDLLLELHERLNAAGLVAGGSFEMPLKQETIAQALGLSTVHINRTLQLLRSEGALVWQGKVAKLTNPALLARQIGRSRTTVSA